MAERRPVQFKKIDVEAYELPALTGLPKTLKHERPIIVTEIFRDTTEENEKYLTFLGDLNYEFAMAGSDGTITPFGHDPHLAANSIKIFEPSWPDYDLLVTQR